MNGNQNPVIGEIGPSLDLRVADTEDDWIDQL